MLRSNSGLRASELIVCRSKMASTSTSIRKKAEHDDRTTGHGVPEIDAKELEIGEIIGKGSFGTVYRGKCRGVPVAVKIVDTKGGLDQKALDAFRREVEIVSSVFSPHVCLYMGACTHDPRQLMIVTELMKTDLEHLLRDKQQASTLTLYRRMIIAREAALGLAWLHGADPILIHRDVKPSNFLVDDNLRCKITDFGLSQIRHRGERLIDRSGAVGTPLYMAPEVLNGAPFNEKSDMYSFGLVLWVLITGEVPYRDLDDLSNDSFADAVCGGHRPALPADIPPALRRLIKDCWADDPSARPTAVRVADQLADVVLDVAILDDAARTFWREKFGHKEDVAWRDAETAVLDFFGAGGKSSRGAYVHALLGKTRDNGQDMLSLEWFGRVIDWFGPINEANLEEMYATLAEKWFHGDVATSDAERMLGDQAVGAFLVRFSTQSRGLFTVSRIATNNAIHHQRILHRPLLAEFRVLDHHYKTLREMITGETKSLQLKEPCPGSKFHGIFQKRSVAGYANDVSPEQQLWLNQAAIGDDRSSNEDFS